MEVAQELDKDVDVRQLLEINVLAIIEVANERLNLVDSSCKTHRPAGNSMSILALLMMGSGCQLPHGLKSAILHGIEQDQFAKHYAPRKQLMQEFADVVGGYDPRGGVCVEWPKSGVRVAHTSVPSCDVKMPSQTYEITLSRAAASSQLPRARIFARCERKAGRAVERKAGVALACIISVIS